MPTSFMMRPWAVAAVAAAVVAAVVVVVVLANRTDPPSGPPPEQPPEQPPGPNDPKPPDKPPDKPPGPNDPKTPDKPDPGAPSLWLDANGSTTGEVVRGWPLLLEAGVFHPAAFKPSTSEKPLLLAAKEGPWSAALRIEVHDARGQPQSWPLQLSGSPPATLSLDRGAPGVLTWTVPPEETAKIAEGDYQLVAVLDTTSATAPEAWRGKVASPPLAVRVRGEPSPLTPQQESEKYQLLAAYHLLRGDAGRALALADELLKKQPEDAGALQLKGDLLARDGKTEEAIAAYDRAVTVYLKRYGTKAEPPRDLLRKRNELLNKLQPPKKQP